MRLGPRWRLQLIDRGHAATTELSLDGVAILEGFSEGEFYCSHETAGWETLESGSVVE